MKISTKLAINLISATSILAMAAPANADELTQLKSQLEALQSRVNSLESRPAASAPAGASLLTVARGQGGLADWGTNDQPADRGFTIGVTPTADLPAPVAEVTIYGYVKGDVIYDFETPTFTPSFSVPAYAGASNDDHVTLHAYQSRFGIKSKVDTAVGQIRSMIEMDLFGNFGSTIGQPRLRHAYGEWDITPNWTLLVGQTWRTASILSFGVALADFKGSAGPGSMPRAAQVRLTYHDGPITWGTGIEKPSWNTDTSMPNLSTYVKYDFTGGNNVQVSGTVADAGPGKGTGWAVLASTNLNLADVATLTVGGVYGKGEPMNYMVQDPFSWLNSSGRPREAWGAAVGLTVPVTDTVKFDVQYGHADAVDNVGAGNIDHTDTVHGNILWQPVSQMRMGWEVMWGRASYKGGGHDDGTRAQFGTWFFF